MGEILGATPSRVKEAMWYEYADRRFRGALVSLAFVIKIEAVSTSKRKDFCLEIWL
jgi:hypothetical protein